MTKKKKKKKKSINQPPEKEKVGGKRRLGRKNKEKEDGIKKLKQPKGFPAVNKLSW